MEDFLLEAEREGPLEEEDRPSDAQQNPPPQETPLTDPFAAASILAPVASGHLATFNAAATPSEGSGVDRDLLVEMGGAHLKEGLAAQQ
jgi:hypothetical protein